MNNADIAQMLRAIASDASLLAQFVRNGRFEIKLGNLTLRCDADKVEALAEKLVCPERARAAEEIQFSMERAYRELRTVGPWDWQTLPKGSAAKRRAAGEFY